MTRTSSRSALRRTGCFLALACSIWAMAGCSNTTHQQQKAQARKNWNQVRAKLKHQLASQQFQAGHVESAITTTHESLGLDPENTEAHVLLMLALLEKGELAAAQRALQMVAELNLDSPDLAYTTGIIAERAGQLEEAVVAYGHAAELDPGGIEFVIAQAECLVALDRPGEAQQLVADNLERFDRDGSS